MKNKLFLTLFLIFIVAIAGMNLLVNGPAIIGKDFADSDVIQQEQQEFMDDLQYYVLNPIDFEEAKKQITVTEEEISYYREYYGSLSSQLENVRSQYEDLLADPGLTTEDRAMYEKERDDKMQEIRKNFESDEVVKEKILTIKNEALAKFEKTYNQRKKQFEERYPYFGYKLTDQFGNTYERAMNGALLNRLTYKENEEWYIDGGHDLSLNDYTRGQPGIHSVELYLQSPDIQVVGEILLSKSILKQQYIKQEKQAFTVQQWTLYTLTAIGIIAAILLMTVWKPNRAIFNTLPNVEQRFAKLPMDMRLAFPIVASFFFLSFLENFPYRIKNIAYWFDEGHRFISFSGELFEYIVAFLCMSAMILTGIWMYDAIQKEGLREENSIIIRTVVAIRESFLNKSIGKQTMAMFIVFFLAGLGFGGVLIQPFLLLLYVPLVLFVLLPVMYIYFKRMGYLNRVMKQTEDMAAGRLTSAIDVKGKSPIAKHAESLNDLRRGIEQSVKERAKSERLKTELITNVSHDLRTPLTSIITYTDLLKNKDLTEEERKKYVDVLDKKSAKLKTLIEDLFEVSKMASGNIEILKQRVDLAQMLQQAAGEHEEDFKAAGLDLRVAIHEQPIYAEVDGQKWWRVVDNLLVNARKYSLEGTRVYVSLQVVSGVAEFSIKNVAKYELGENIEELTERFKRADTSRHTEGSGLGLAIAQSIIDLHGGQLKLDVDGDLFKVTVRVNTV
ncbi:MAG: histidine kinase dimerization/phospho-acceptor domain-containing protein [Lysinibacillus sp.]